jgi:hypothetical protein
MLEGTRPHPRGKIVLRIALTKVEAGIRPGGWVREGRGT